MGEFNVKRISIAKKKDTSKMWSTSKVDQWLYNEKYGIKNSGPSPFFEDNILHRKGGIHSFDYTEEEEAEIAKCVKNVEYFADKYCYAMTDDGVQKIELYNYQRDTLKCFQNNRYVIYLASRQVGKCSYGNTKIQTKNKKISLVNLFFNNIESSFLEQTKYFLYNCLNNLKIIKYIILFLIQLIEKYEYRNLELNEEDDSKKIIQTIDISNKNIEVLTDVGYKKISHIHKTQPYTIFKITTSSNKVLECADRHILFDENMNEVFVKNLKINNKIKTKNGNELIIKIEKLPFKVSMFDITINSNDHRYYTNDILSHNTITSAFYIMWYACFNIDRNILIVANKGDTMKEIIKKVQAVYNNLPYFLKPGLLVRNVKSLEFDNGCRIIGQETSETPGLGFAIHLLYMDEFAHIPANKKTPFYRSVIPTMSSSEISQAIITSTPNKTELFYELYMKAIPWKESNDEIKLTKPFVSITTYWDAVPGHDENWKKQQIALLGGHIEDWNQEFECSFLSTSDLFLDSQSLKFLDRIKKTYVFKEISCFEDKYINYQNLKFDEDFDIDNISVNDRFVISIDTADGAGKDFFAVNIFILEPMSIAQIRKHDQFIDESDFFRFRQIALFHDNNTSIDDVMQFLEVLFFEFFNVNQIRIVLEMNFKGDLIYDNIKRHKEFYVEMFVRTRHSETDERLKPGLKLNKKNKNLLVNDFKRLFKQKRIIINESKTVSETKMFGMTKKGVYGTQSGHDDLIMSCVDMVCIFGTEECVEMIEDTFDFVDDIRKALINKKILEIDKDSSDMVYYNLIKEYN